MPLAGVNRENGGGRGRGEKTYSPPTAPPRKEKPFDRARYFKGRTSEGMAWTIEIVASVVPIKMPPTISMAIDEALAEITAPMKAIRGGMLAKYFLSRTSESRPTMGERTLCISNGPFFCQC